MKASRIGRALGVLALLTSAACSLHDDPPDSMPRKPELEKGDRNGSDAPPCANMSLGGLAVTITAVPDSGGLYDVELGGMCICEDDAAGLFEAGIQVSQLPPIVNPTDGRSDGTPLPGYTADNEGDDGTPLPARSTHK